jgi:hypothetical protein
MKYLVLILAVVSTSCAPLVAGGIGIATGVALTTNEPRVEEFGDKYLSKGE